MTALHTEINMGRQGAKRQSFSEKSPRTVLLKIIAEHPHETRQDMEVILDLFWQTIHKNEAHLRTICDYWGVNNYTAIVHVTQPRNQLKENEEVSNIKSSILSKIILLDWILPNGKKLRDCTKTDCTKAGGWLLKVGKKLKTRQTVGQVFSEEQLHNLAQ